VSESEEGKGRDLSRLVVGRAGRVVATGDAVEPFRVVGPDGGVVEPVSVFLRELRASGKAAGTLRSYSVDLLLTCCGGGGSWTPSASGGTGRRGSRRGTSAAGSS